MKDIKILTENEKEFCKECFLSGFNPFQTWLMAKNYYKRGWDKPKPKKKRVKK